MNYAIIDLGFGDSGKGVTTSFVCSKFCDPKTGIVIRSNGGHQAGHTVVVNEFRHVFSQFGSGTLQGFPTYISEFCTIYPPSLMREYAYIKQFNPKLIVNPLAMITTPFDIDFNRDRESKVNHGSVGMGFGQTIQRNEDHFKLHVRDLQYELIFRRKLFQIGTIYYNLPKEEVHMEIDAFWNQCNLLLKAGFFKIEELESSNYEDFIFESAQGTLLDMDFGFFPNVTRSNTTLKNVYSLINKYSNNSELDVFYCTRSYATRHGNGFLPNEHLTPPRLDMSNGEETNKSHKYQGEFRIAPLSIESLAYALSCNHLIDNKGVSRQESLVVTCMDQHRIDVNQLLADLQPISFNQVYTSYSPDGTKMKRFL